MLRAQALEHRKVHDAPVKLAQAQNMRLPISLVTDLHLSDDPLPHLLLTSPILQPISLLVVLR